MVGSVLGLGVVPREGRVCGLSFGLGAGGPSATTTITTTTTTATTLLLVPTSNIQQTTYNIQRTTNNVQHTAYKVQRVQRATYDSCKCTPEGMLAHERVVDLVLRGLALVCARLACISGSDRCRNVVLGWLGCVGES